MKKLEIADLFKIKLIEEIGEENFNEALRLNIEENSILTCHSHDFCDANMIMLDAFENIMGCKFDFSYKHYEVMNGAWAVFIIQSKG